MLGLRNTNLWLNLSSTQSISLPIMLKSALLSTRTLTPSCSTASSKAPAFSTYSRWYASPEHPRFFTPILMSFGSGSASRFRSWFTADVVKDIAAFRGRNLDVLGLDTEDWVTGLGFWASASGRLTLDVSSRYEVEG